MSLVLWIILQCLLVMVDLLLTLTLLVLVGSPKPSLLLDFPFVEPRFFLAYRPRSLVVLSWLAGFFLLRVLLSTLRHVLEINKDVRTDKSDTQ